MKMNKATRKSKERSYDFSKGVRGKYSGRVVGSTRVNHKGQTCHGTEEERKWEETLASPKSQKLLKQMAADARKTKRLGQTRRGGFGSRSELEATARKAPANYRAGKTIAKG
jgi:hypothetical protein